MNKYLVLFGLFFLLIIGCTNFDPTLSKEEIAFGELCTTNYETVNIQTESKMITLSAKDYCYFEIAKHFDKSDYCGFIKYVGYRDDCYYHFGLAKKSEELCYAISGPLEQKCLTIIRLDTLTYGELIGDYDYPM